jgi:hypothetical protein
MHVRRKYLKGTLKSTMIASMAQGSIGNTVNTPYTRMGVKQKLAQEQVL